MLLEVLSSGLRAQQDLAETTKPCSDYKSMTNITAAKHAHQILMVQFCAAMMQLDASLTSEKRNNSF